MKCILLSKIIITVVTTAATSVQGVLCVGSNAHNNLEGRSSPHYLQMRKLKHRWLYNWLKRHSSEWQNRDLNSGLLILRKG